jgi:asparagine synthase (glutamine-hydrolysing)
MAASLSHRDWYVTEHFKDQANGLAIGRIGIGIFNKTPQPFWNADKTISLMMAGEIYRADINAPSGEVKYPEQAVLASFERYGVDFAQKLNGAFIIAIWDKVNRLLLIANDRFGLYPLFFAHRDGTLIFGPEMKAVLCDHAMPRNLDLNALAQYIRFQQVLGERTFFEDIKMLPWASVLIYNLRDLSCQIKRYWDWNDIPYRPEVTFNEAVEETGRLLRRAVKNLSEDTYRPGVYLSGGLDSRTILGLITRRPVVSLTYGTGNCRDVYYASKIAQAVGSDHHWIDLRDGNWVKQFADFHLELTEGYHSWIHAHGISTLTRARDLFDINLTGWDGGTLMGDADTIEPLLTAAVDNWALITRLFYLFNQKYTWPSITEAEENLLYRPSFRSKVKDLAFDSFCAELNNYLKYRPDVRSEFFYIRNHCGRFTQNLVTFTRSHVEVRFPFFDYDLFEFLHSIPAALREDKKLFLAVIRRETPRLAWIPYDHDELLPTSQNALRAVHGFGVKLKSSINCYLVPIFPQRETLYADYERYLRGELREWARSLLADKRVAERGIFEPAFINTLLNRHFSGLEEWTIGKIAPLMTYEMMLRRFYD